VTSSTEASADSSSGEAGQRDPSGEAGQRDPATDRLTADELRTLFLFEALNGDQLARLVEHGRVRQWAAGSSVSAEGDPRSEELV
jgi:hypothetical protein